MLHALQCVRRVPLLLPWPLAQWRCRSCCRAPRCEIKHCGTDSSVPSAEPSSPAPPGGSGISQEPARRSKAPLSAPTAPSPTPNNSLESAIEAEEAPQHRPAAEGMHLPTGRRLEGQATLLVVSLLWGSYTPAIKLAYALPDPPSPLVLAAARGNLQLLLLLVPALVWGTAARWQQQAAQPGGSTGMLVAQPAERNEVQQPLILARRSPWQQQQHAAAAMVMEEEGPSLPPLPLGLPAAVLAALEIGLYNTTGTLLQTTALELTTATRAAFLIQLSTLFTPLLATLAGMAPSRRVWLGSLLALAGTLFISVDCWELPEALLGPAVATASATAGGAAVPPLPLGDMLTVAAALCYSAATVRIPVWAVRHGVAPLHLALGKAAMLAAVSTAALALEAARIAADGKLVMALWPGWRQPEGWAIIAWTAFGPGALAAFLHVKGQSLVSPTDAQILFCSVPLWSALMAAGMLPDEAVELGTWVGGAVIVAGGLVAAPYSRRR